MIIKIDRNLKIKLLTALKAGEIDTDAIPEVTDAKTSLRSVSDMELMEEIIGFWLKEAMSSPDRLRGEVSIKTEWLQYMDSHNGQLDGRYSNPEMIKEYARRIFDLK